MFVMFYWTPRHTQVLENKS